MGDIPATYRGERDNLPRRGEKKPRRMKLLEKARLAPFIIGAICVLAAIALEHFVSVFWPAGGASEPAPSGSMHTFNSMIFNSKTLVLWFAEIGYAFIIAGIVSVFIEVNARREQYEDTRQAREEISLDVVNHIFGIKHSKEYVRAVIGTCFESPLVREGYDINFDIIPFSEYEDDELGISPGRFIKVDATIRYLVRNVSAEGGKFLTGYGIPLRSGKLRELSRITKLKIGHEEFTGNQLDSLERSLPHGDIHERMYEFELKLDANASIDVSIEATIVKERSDNDAFGFRRPTSGAEIKINDRVGGLVYGVTPRTSAACELVKTPRPGSSGEWKLIGPILPYDSVVIWWRTPADDGAEENLSIKSSKNNGLEKEGTSA